MGIFLGTANIRAGSIKYVNYKKAKKYALKLNLKNAKEWFKHTKSKNFPKDIPVAVHNIYKRRFEGWGTFLGSGYISTVLRSKNYVNYQKAKKYARSLKLQKSSEWSKHTRSKNFPKDIPAAVQNVYKKKFEGWGTFLGSGNKQGYYNRNYISYNKVKKYAAKNNIKNRNEWIEHCQNKNIPQNIPQTVNYIYKNKGWISWNDFLRTSKFKSFGECKSYARTLKLKGWSDWKSHFKKKKPLGVPSKPYNTYKKEWKGWADFLGTGRKPQSKKS